MLFDKRTIITVKHMSCECDNFMMVDIDPVTIGSLSDLSLAAPFQHACHFSRLSSNEKNS